MVAINERRCIEAAMAWIERRMAWMFMFQMHLHNMQAAVTKYLSLIGND